MPTANPLQKTAPRYISATAVARLVGVHPQTVLNWASRGLLSKRQINARVVRFDMQEVERLMSAKPATSTTEAGR
jgi:DNA-binding transcriptional MerR regulator